MGRDNLSGSVYDCFGFNFHEPLVIDESADFNHSCSRSDLVEELAVHFSNLFPLLDVCYIDSSSKYVF